VATSLGSVVLVAGFVVGGAAWSTHRIENDLTTRGQAALDAAGLHVTVHYDGRDAVLTGSVSRPHQGADAIGTLIHVNGTRHVISRLAVSSSPLSGTAGSSTPDATTSPGTAAAPDQGSGSPALPAGRITFTVDDAALSASATSYLDRVASFLVAHPQLTVAVRGHSDASGTDDINWALSERRAAVVVDYLVSHQVPAERLHPKAFAATSPVASNATPEGRAANRRVELAIEETR
jgi:outer membrane protein OmpA-like peptidoglycan-associated protein